VRGSAPDESLYLIDNAKVPLLFHYFGISSIFESELVESTNFSPGAFGAEYSDSLGGVVKVNLRDPREDKIGGFADLSLISGSFMVEGPVSKNSSFAVAAKGSSADLYSKAIMDGSDDFSYTAYPSFYNGTAIFRHQFSENNFLKLYTVGAIDKSNVMNAENSDPLRYSYHFDRDILFDSIAVDWHYNIGKIESILTPSFSYESVKFNLGEGGTFEYSEIQAGLKEKISYKIDDMQTITGGLSFNGSMLNLSSGKFAMPFEGEPFIRPFKTELGDSETEKLFSMSLFVIDTIKIDKLTLNPGVAYFMDFTNNQYSYENINPRLTAEYEVMKNLSFSAGGGIYSKMPESYISFEPFGTTELEPEQSIHSALGVKNRQDNLEISLAGYYKYLYNLISRSKSSPDKYRNMGTGNSFGAELTVKYEMKELLAASLSYSLSKTKLKDSPGSDERDSDFDIPHNLIVAAEYKPFKLWLISARFNFQSGLPVTEYNGSTLYADGGFRTPEYGTINGERLPMRHQLDIRVDKFFEFDKWMLDTYIDVKGAYGFFHKNIVGKAYSEDYLDSVDISTLPFIVSAGVKGSF